MSHRYLLPLLVVSGFAGLSYELLWVRLLSFSFGSTTLSFSTVLAVFFGGLAFGSWLGGRAASRWSRPARAYAFLEIGTGAAGIVLYFALAGLGSVFAAIDPGPNLAGAVVRFLIAMPLLLAPTALMGATLPFVTRAMITKSDEIARGTALIYGINTTGAFLGAYLVTFFLLPKIGIFSSNLLTVFLNLLVGTITLVLERREPDTAGLAEEAAADGQQVEPKIVRTGIGLTFAGGFAAIAFQIVWARLFAVFLEGTIYALGSVLMAVLIGIGLGSIAVAPIFARTRHPAVWFVGLQIAAGLGVVVIDQALPWISYVLQDPPVIRPGLSRLHVQLGIIFFVLLVPMVCSGASFPLLIGIIERQAARASRSLGNLYAANTMGSILGSFAGGFVLLPMIGSTGTLFAALVIVCGVGSIAAAILARSLPRPLSLLLILAAFSPAALFEGFDLRDLSFPKRATGFAVSEASAAQRDKQLVFLAEGKTGNVAVVEQDGVRGLYLSGLGQGMVRDLPPRYHLESVLAAAVPAAHAPDLDSAFLVGLGAGGTVDVLRDLNTKSIHVVELEARVLDALEILYGTHEVPLLHDPRVKIEINDARHVLMLNARTESRFSLIASMPAHPWVAAGIFTKEFFELARANLSERGVFCTWFGVGKMDEASMHALIRAFVSVFPNYIVYHFPDALAYYLVGSPSALTFDLERLEKVKNLAPQIDSTFSLPMRVYATGTVETAPPAPGVVNSDDTPFVETHAPLSSTIAGALDGFLPAEHIQPALVAPEARVRFYTGLLEAQLGTPNGLLPVERATTTAVKTTKRTLDAARDVLSTEWNDYFTGRLALAEGRRADARSAFQRAAQSADPVVAARARTFAAMTIEDAQDRIRELLTLPPRGDILVAIAEENLELALTHASRGDPNVEQDPIGWFLWRAARAKEQPFGESDRGAILRHVGPALSKSTGVRVIQVCSELLDQPGFEELATTCARWAQRAKEASAARHHRAALAAGSRGDFKTAVTELRKALDVRPDDFATTTLLMRAAVETSDSQTVQWAKELLRFQGRTEEDLAALERDAQRRRKASKPLAPDVKATPQ